MCVCERERERERKERGGRGWGWGGGGRAGAQGEAGESEAGVGAPRARAASRTVFLHHLEEAHDDLARWSYEHLALAALLGVEDRLERVGEDALRAQGGGGTEEELGSEPRSCRGAHGRRCRKMEEHDAEKARERPQPRRTMRILAAKFDCARVW